MTVTGVTESVTPITVAGTITSRCRNTSHSAVPQPRTTAQPSRQTPENRHSRHLRMGALTAKPPTEAANPKWGLSQPAITEQQTSQPRMWTFTADWGG